jgi:alkylation response protein AidB-like acyl-CoA dehydrogenase
MSYYRAPIEEISFTLETMANMRNWSSVNGFEEAGEDLVHAVLQEAGKLANDVVAPTNRVGDEEGAKLKDGVVTTPDAFKPMHEAFVEGGWSTLAADPELGGQGLPASLEIAVTEMVTSANMAYSLQPLLTSGAIEAIKAHGDETLRAKYLPKMISGEWSGAMNLTEPAAGSDVGALRSKAERQPDGTYRITGQKIYITWGEHDLCENIVHLVLARLPGAPAGTKGISMFIVPKFLVNDDGSLGERNDVKCTGLEHKLGIHASPTCVMAFGENNNCIGYLVGEENCGMRNMFTMMNHARIGVGLQGVAIAERAYQHAVTFAQERVQSAAIGAKTRDSVAIINHPDVRRMLMTMRATAEAARAIIYRNVWATDRAHTTTDANERRSALGEADLLTPISKAYATDIGVEAASLCVQVHGGMGFVEETGVAQYYRDVRIAPIYEGTNGIQALDLVGRKLNSDGGAHWRTLIAEMRDFASGLDRSMMCAKTTLLEGVDALESAAENLFANGFENIVDTAGAATPYLRLFGTVVGAYLLARQAVEAERRLASDEGDPAFLTSKITVARFYIEQLLPPATALLAPIKAGARSIMEMDNLDFERA